MRPRNEVSNAIVDALIFNNGALTSNRLHKATNVQLFASNYKPVSKPVFMDRLDELVYNNTIKREKMQGQDASINLPVTYRLNLQSTPANLQYEVTSYLKEITIDRNTFRDLSPTERRLVLSNYLGGIEYCLARFIVMYAFEGVHLDFKKMHLDLDGMIKTILDKAKQSFKVILDLEEKEADELFLFLYSLKQKRPRMLSLEQYRQHEEDLKRMHQPKTKEQKEEEEKENRITTKALYAMYKEFAKGSPDDPEIQKLLKDLEAEINKTAKKKVKRKD